MTFPNKGMGGLRNLARINEERLSGPSQQEASKGSVPVSTNSQPPGEGHYQQLMVGIARCPLCKAQLVSQSGESRSWHECSSRQGCRYTIMCVPKGNCVLGRVIQNQLEPCRFGHKQTWVKQWTRGRVSLLLCRGSGAGHRAVCGEEMRYWKGPKPAIPKGVTPKYDTKKAVLDAFLDGPMSVRTCSEISSISNRAVRACVRRCLNAAHQHLERHDTMYDPAADRTVERFRLTEIGLAWVCYWRGYNIDEYRHVVGGYTEPSSLHYPEEKPRERPVARTPSVSLSYRGIDALPSEPPIR